MPLGGGQAEEVLEALTRARSYVRKRLGKALRLRYVPNVDFEMDITFDEVSKIGDLLNDPRVARDLAVESDNTSEETDDHGA
jgi:ribosome-binding factor A